MDRRKTVSIMAAFVLLLCLVQLGSQSIDAESGGNDRAEIDKKISGPEEPSVDDPVSGREKSPEINAAVYFAAGTVQEGTIRLESGRIRLQSQVNGIDRTWDENIEGIASIEFMQWSGTERRRNEFIFLPSKLRITMRDSAVYMCQQAIEELKKIQFKDNAGEDRYIYTYFFDYRKYGRWVNSGEEDMNFPDNNPHKDTVVKIIFKKETKPINLLENILKQ